MSFGALARLPLTASDFASACFTADVQPRKYLRLLLVRVVATNHSGTVEPSRCRTVALLFDSRHKVPRMVSAARDAIRASRRTRAETNDSISSARFFTRVRGTITPIDDVIDSRSVYEETVVSDGVLRGTLHSGIGGALAAFTNHCTQPSQVCLRKVAEALADYKVRPPSKPSPLAERYIAGLCRLGVTKPTATIADACICTENADCSCFMSRAVWRAGSSWMIIYTIMPPPLASAVVSAKGTSLSPLWIDRLIDAEVSESVDGESLIDGITPNYWHTSILKYIAVSGVSSRSLLRLVERLLDEEGSDDDSSTSLSMTELPSLTLIMVACTWALSSPAFLDALPSIGRRLGLYYKTTIDHVLATSQRQDLIRRVLRVALTIPPSSDENIFTAMLSASDGPAVVGAVMSIMATHSSVWKTQAARTQLRSCEMTGYSLIITCSLVVFCQSYASTFARAVNTWDLYEYCPALLEV